MSAYQPLHTPVCHVNAQELLKLLNRFSCNKMSGNLINICRYYILVKARLQ